MSEFRALIGGGVLNQNTDFETNVASGRLRNYFLVNKFGEKTDVTVRISTCSANNTSVIGRFDAVLVKS